MVVKKLVVRVIKGVGLGILALTLSRSDSLWVGREGLANNGKEASPIILNYGKAVKQDMSQFTLEELQRRERCISGFDPEPCK